MLLSEEEILKKIIEFMGEAGREAFNNIINNEVEEALMYEKKREINRATKALYEAKLKDEDIIQLLYDHWKVEKGQETEALRIEKTIKSPTKVLINYLQSQGYKNSDIKEFIINNDVEKKLENNQSLWKLSNSPDKLMKAVSGKI